MNSIARAPSRATGATTSKPAALTENLSALCEAIFIHLHQLVTLDEADDAAMSQRLTAMAAERFKAWRDNAQPSSEALEELFDIEALVHGAYDVEDVTSARLELLHPVMEALDRATALLSGTPEWCMSDMRGARAPACVEQHASSITSEQAKIILEVIASKAHVMMSLCTAAILEDGVSQEAADLIEAARDLASQSGLLADHGVSLLGGVGLKRADIAEWFLPPIYPKDAASGEQQ